MAPKYTGVLSQNLTRGSDPLSIINRRCISNLTKGMLNEGEASRNDGPSVPDLILYDNDNRTTPVTVEVCHTDGLRRDSRKVIRLIAEDEYGILEGFVYDYSGNQ